MQGQLCFSSEANVAVPFASLAIPFRRLHVPQQEVGNSPVRVCCFAAAEDLFQRLPEDGGTAVACQTAEILILWQ